MADSAADTGIRDDALNSFFIRVRDEAIPHIAAATVPIYGFQDNRSKETKTARESFSRSPTRTSS